MLYDVVRASALPDGYMDGFFDIHEYDDGDLPVLEGLTMSIQKTIHPINTYSLSFVDATGSRFVYTSDTAWSADVVKFCRGADLLLIECTDPPGIVVASPRWHLSPQEVATFVADVGPSTAVITHYEDKYSSEIYSLVSGANPRSDIHLAIEHKEFTI